MTALDIIRNLKIERDRHMSWVSSHFGSMPDGHFGAIAIDNKQCVLAPYPEFAISLYRGQTKFYEPCVSSLFRSNTNKIDRFISYLRIAEFQLLLSSHPAVVDFAKWKIMDLSIRIDYEGLAQHYGLKTQLVDLTSDPYVAAFFACCEYDTTLNQYKPVLKANHKGVIYKFSFALNSLVEDQNSSPSRSSVVGLQPLDRPAEQYAYCYRLTKKQSLNSMPYFKPYFFTHDPKISIKVFERFEGGKTLFPSDPVKEKAIAISKTMKISAEALHLVMAKFKKKFKEKKTINDLKRKGIIIVEKSQISFTEKEKLIIQGQWNLRREDILSKIGVRRCF